MAIDVSSASEARAADLDAFAAAVAHEIRTPLSAVAGEVEIALRRDRTAGEYRAALERIAAGVAELVEMSADLALVGEPPRAAAGAADLGAILSRVRDRYKDRQEIAVDVEFPAATRVSGDEAHLARAIVLLLEHALRYRKDHAALQLRGCVGASDGPARLVIEAHSSGFWPTAWRALRPAAAAAPVPLRLRTVLWILAHSGGALSVDSAAGAERVYIDLQSCP
jgi:two-component system OmpR family sensor kinase